MMNYVLQMIGNHRNHIAFIPLLVLSACGPAQNDPGPGGVTVGEAKLLDEAAEMLDERNSPAEPVKQQTGVPSQMEAGQSDQ